MVGGGDPHRAPPEPEPRQSPPGFVTPLALLRRLFRSPSLFERGNNRRSTGGTEFALRFLWRVLRHRPIFQGRPSLSLRFGDCFAPGSTHPSPRLS